jgi:Right handed beta helix region
VLRLKSSFAVITIAACVLCAAPSAASAADTFVNDDGGNDAGSCTTQAQPCLTIAAGITKAGNGDDVFIDGGAYSGSLTLDNGKSLRELNFNTADGDTEAIIDGGLPSPAISVTSPSGTIQGLTLRGAVGAVQAFADVTITGNTFDDDVDTGGLNGSLQLGSTGTASFIVEDNVFTDPTQTDDQFAIDAALGGTATTTISGNTINGFRKGIEVVSGAGGTQEIRDNTITGMHSENVLGVPGIGIWIEESTANLTDNLMQQPGDATNGNIGITAFTENPGVDAVNVTMARNEVYNQATTGVDLSNTSTATLNGDVIANNGVGLRNLQQDASTPGLGNTNARNITVWGNGDDINMSSVDLTLNSSIVEDAISVASGEPDDPAPICNISFSRGPVMNPTSNFGCDNFQTTAAPGFVDPTSGINNFHLTAGSPMIDMGSTIDPPPGTLDVDGQARVLDGDCNGSARVDIGADEFSATCGGGTAPPTITPPTAVPLTPTTPAPSLGGTTVKKKKKCKKKRAKSKKCKRKK